MSGEQLFHAAQNNYGVQPHLAPQRKHIWKWWYHHSRDIATDQVWSNECVWASADVILRVDHFPSLCPQRGYWNTKPSLQISGTWWKFSWTLVYFLAAMWWMQKYEPNMPSGFDVSSNYSVLAPKPNSWHAQKDLKMSSNKVYLKKCPPQNVILTSG